MWVTLIFYIRINVGSRKLLWPTVRGLQWEVNDELWKRRVILVVKLVIGYNQLGHEHNMGILNMLRLYG